MSTLHELGEDWAIAGAHKPEELEKLREKYEGVLYLCCDAGEDTGVEGGSFQDVEENWKMSRSAHVKISPKDVAFRVPGAASDDDDINEAWLAAVRMYAKCERALNSLPRPTLVMCKSSKRAGLIYSVYTAVKEGLSFKHIVDTNIMQWHGDGNFKYWASTVLDAYSRQRIPPGTPGSLIFRQLFEPESSTYTYLLAEPKSNECILIDPVIETVERDLDVIGRLGYQLKYVINTHVHADHITGTGKLKQSWEKICADSQGAFDVDSPPQSAISEVSQAQCDVPLSHNNHLSFGDRKLYCVSTPGHTEGCMTYILDDLTAVFTGDALLIGGCGRTDFQGGSSDTLYDSVTQQIFSLPDTVTVYPAHDYKGRMQTSVGIERNTNPRLGGNNNKDSFRSIMANLNLPRPKKMDASLPANMKCGV